MVQVPLQSVEIAICYGRGLNGKCSFRAIPQALSGLFPAWPAGDVNAIWRAAHRPRTGWPLSTSMKSPHSSIRPPSRAPGTQLVLCAGLKSSGSTWLYNAVIQLCELANAQNRKSRRQIAAFYADSLEEFPQRSKRHGLLIVKTHIPSEPLVFLSAFVGAPVFITVREPRDAIASLMNRFGHTFETSLEEVSRGAERLIELSQTGRPLVLRYERNFISRPDTVERLRKKLGLTLSQARVGQVVNSLTAENVQRKIAALEKKGVFGVRPDPDRFDAKTHWHPGHIGNRQIGTYGAVLSIKMQKRVLCATADYCAKFGYAASLR